MEIPIWQGVSAASRMHKSHGVSIHDGRLNSIMELARRDRSSRCLCIEFVKDRHTKIGIVGIMKDDVSKANALCRHENGTGVPPWDGVPPWSAQP